MKYLKPQADWLAENANIEELVRLGLVDPESLTQIVFNLRQATLNIFWQSAQRENLDGLRGVSTGSIALGDLYLLAPGSSQKHKSTLGLPPTLPFSRLTEMAQSMRVGDFIQSVDDACLDWLKTAIEEKGVFDSDRPDLIRSSLTGRIVAVKPSPGLNESGLDRLVQLGLVDPNSSNRLEWVANQAVLLDIHSQLARGHVPTEEMSRPLFFVWGYDETGKPTKTHTGTDVLSREVLKGSDLADLAGLEIDALFARVESIFVEWLRAQPDEYFEKRFGFKSRPLFARDETSAILGFEDWTTIAESRDSNFNRLLSLGLVDPISQPRVAYKVSDWWTNYMTNLKPSATAKSIWRDDVAGAIVGRVQIYSAGSTDVSRWVSLTGRELFRGPDDIERIRQQGLGADELRELAEELIVDKIVRGFRTNWSTSPRPDPDPSEERLPTLIKGSRDPDWRPFSITESRDARLMQLFTLGLVGSVAYISYEINQQRLADLQQEFLDPRASEPAFRKHLMYNVLTNSFAWWEHRLPEEAGKADPSLKLAPIVDGDYLLDEGAMSMRTLMDADDPLDFDVPFEEFLQEIRSRILEHLRSSDIEYVERHMPLYILDKDTSFKYWFETGERLG